MKLNVVDLKVDPQVTKHVTSLLKMRTRDQRYKLHKYYKSFPSDKEARKHKPSTLTDDNWKSLCDYWSKPKVQV